MFFKISWSCGSDLEEELAGVMILVLGSRWRERCVYVSRLSSVAILIVDVRLRDMWSILLNELVENLRYSLMLNAPAQKVVRVVEMI